MLEPQAFEDVKAFLDDIIAYAVVTVDGEEIKCPIHRRERMKDGRVAVYIQITPATKGEGILLEEAQEGVLYRFTFKFLEQEV